MSRNHPLRARERSGEFEAFTNWRYVLAYFEKPGVTKKIKRGYNKRVRSYYKSQLRQVDQW